MSKTKNDMNEEIEVNAKTSDEPGLTEKPIEKPIEKPVEKPVEKLVVKPEEKAPWLNKDQVKLSTQELIKKKFEESVIVPGFLSESPPNTILIIYQSGTVHSIRVIRLTLTDNRLSPKPVQGPR